MLDDTPKKEPVSILGVRVDPTFTIANLIQICLIVFGVLNGTYLLYFGLKAQFAAIDVAQQSLVQEQANLANEIAGVQAERKARADRVDARLDNLTARISQQETAAAVTTTTTTTTNNRIAELITKVENLDTYLRNIATAVKER